MNILFRSLSYFVVFCLIAQTLLAFDGIPNGGRFIKHHLLYSDPTLNPENFAEATLVNLCSHKKTGKQVVIKAAKGDIVPLLENEARIFKKARKISGIVKHYGSIKGKNRRYEILEYCPGGDAQNLLVREGRRSEDEVRAIFTPITKSLASLHSRYIAHLDIKLDNIFLMDDGSAKLGDFGMSEFVPPGTLSSGSRKGSLPTMAFEVHKAPINGRYDPFKADVFSLGATMAMMVLGHPIYSEPGDAHYEFCLKNGITKMLTIYADHHKITLSPKFMDLIGRMMHKNPNRRPTMAEVLLHPWFIETAPVPTGMPPSF